MLPTLTINCSECGAILAITIASWRFDSTFGVDPCYPCREKAAQKERDKRIKIFGASQGEIGDLETKRDDLQTKLTAKTELWEATAVELEGCDKECDELREQHKTAAVNWSHERDDLREALHRTIAELHRLDDGGVCTLDEDGLCHTCEAIAMSEEFLDAKGEDEEVKG